MSSKRAKTKTTKKRPQRATSNVFAMFDQSQIQEFKEAFNMIDQNRDGFIDKEDLHDMLASLGNLLYFEYPCFPKIVIQCYMNYVLCDVQILLYLSQKPIERCLSGKCHMGMGHS